MIQSSFKTNRTHIIYIYNIRVREKDDFDGQSRLFTCAAVLLLSLISHHTSISLRLSVAIKCILGMI